MKSRRKPVEIYFILYLAALAILMSDGSDTPTNDFATAQQKNVDYPFRIKVQKPLMLCKLYSDSLGNRRLSIDTLNYIFDYGDVQNVQYQFLIEDTQIGHNITLSSKNGEHSRYWTFTQDATERRAIFHWYPDLQNLANRTYNVYVTATAIPLNAANRQRVIAKTQFALVVTNDYTPPNYDIENSIPIPNETTSPVAPMQTTIQQPHTDVWQLADYTIRAKDDKIYSVQGEEWTNEIYFFGASPKYLANVPSIKIENHPADNGGAVYQPIITENSIILKGRTPQKGSSRVIVDVTRNNDKKSATTKFDIEPITYSEPNIPSTMYPNVGYTFASGLLDANSSVDVRISENNNIRYQTHSAATFTFNAELSDVGKQLTYERYINGQLVGQRYIIKVVDFPAPMITRISNQSTNEVIVEVTSFGTASGRRNTIVELQIDGNAKYQQLHGKTRENKQKLECYEQFLLTPIDKKKPFSFDVVAVDQRSRKSNTKKYK